MQAQLAAAAGDSDSQLFKRVANMSGSLLKLSKCPDMVVNRGHYFGAFQFNDQEGLSKDEQSFGKEPELSDGDKQALIAFMKSF